MKVKLNKKPSGERCFAPRGEKRLNGKKNRPRDILGHTGENLGPASLLGEKNTTRNSFDEVIF